MNRAKPNPLPRAGHVPAFLRIRKNRTFMGCLLCYKLVDSEKVPIFTVYYIVFWWLVDYDFYNSI